MICQGVGIQYTVLRVSYLNNYSSIAQSVERAAVNRVVVGSSPTRGADFKSRKQ